ncbi:transcriptional regulator [Microbacterium sorbitolivorans]|uniref:MurR/RpiR family transcriptional regulator n=1 Tax=Microbacterium sorbitolivorans TaxID=1867410 RepID=UPI0013B04FEC|nr:MurR/RpiR family transcriptional regulator [Microbacterium sorbitolivorans]GGF37256.1 transcriptional regulator [Microbacterium sorbitolivorans]
MVWSGAADAPLTARIRALAPSLHAGERRVAEFVVGDLALAIESTAQDLADAVGVGRATVVRTAQTLGYDGFPQLRVAAAQELSHVHVASTDDTLVGSLRAAADRFASRIGDSVAALTEESLRSAISALDEAGRVLIVANGLSSPLGLDLQLRLTAAGRPAEILHDALAQRIAARQLSANDVCVIVSGSGANETSLAVARAARDAGATVLSITSFARSALASGSDTALVVPSMSDSFQDELLHTSRVALVLVIETLVDSLIKHRGPRGREARDAVLRELGNALSEP